MAISDRLRQHLTNFGFVVATNGSKKVSLRGSKSTDKHRKNGNSQKKNEEPSLSEQRKRSD